MKVHVLGAGQDVGRSCFLVSMGGRRIMIDCGVHPGYHDERRFPDFASIERISSIDVVLITHFHLDHCGALPILTEHVGYSGPIYMTEPTRELAGLMLEDLHKNSRARRQHIGFSRADIAACLEKVTGFQLTNVLRPRNARDIEIRAYHAGHVVGAVMFDIRVGGESLVYSGDYSTAADRHLAPVACPPSLRPDLFVTEATFCGNTRTNSRRAAEQSLMQAIQSSVERGGKVLIPVSAFGRAQELLLVLKAHLARLEMDVPVYVSAGLVTKATKIYERYPSWCSEEVSKVVGPSAYDFGQLKEFWRSRDWHLVEEDCPMILFATPGMLTSGLSLDVFKRWAGDSRNLVVVPGFCFSHTLSESIMSGVGGNAFKEDIRCKLTNLSFSAHADCRGIQRMIRKVRPKAVMLVHGHQDSTAKFEKKLAEKLRIPVYNPANGTILNINAAAECGSGSDAEDVFGVLESTFDIAPLVQTWKKTAMSYRDGHGHKSNITREAGRYEMPCESGLDILLQLAKTFPDAQLRREDGKLIVGGMHCTYDAEQQKISVEWDPQAAGYNTDQLITKLQSLVDPAYKRRVAEAHV